MLRISISILLLGCSLIVSGQTINWKAGYDGFLDNREYFSTNNPQTIFGARAWGEIGANLGNEHSFMFGMNVLKEFGAENELKIPDLTMYYEYDDAKINFLIGSFPRRNKLNYPLAFLSDTLNYYRPNVEGVYLGINRSTFSQYVFIDWMSRQTDTNYERFIFSTAGEMNFGSFFVENYIMMSHLAAKGIREPDFHLRDNGGVHLNLGLDVSDKVAFDTLLLKFGGILSIDRTRGIDPGWQTPMGFLGQFETRYNFLGLNGLYYAGEGHTFFYGDPFYRLKSYGRLDIYVLPFRSSKVNMKVSFNLHFAKGQVDYSQQLLLSLKL